MYVVFLYIIQHVQSRLCIQLTVTLETVFEKWIRWQRVSNKSENIERSRSTRLKMKIQQSVGRHKYLWLLRSAFFSRLIQ